MKDIIPITDLQRQAGQIIKKLTEKSEPFYITQRGRASAVIISVERYSEIEEDLKRLDELELIAKIAEARKEIKEGKTLSNEEVKKRLKYK